MSDLGFMQQQYDDTPESSVVPAGEYPAKIMGCELKDTKAGTGKYISMKFTIDGMEQAGRTVFTNFNVSNPNPQAEEIGIRQLKQLDSAIGGGFRGKDTDDYLGKQCMIFVTEKDDPQYGKGNEIKSYSALAGAQVAAPSNTQAQGQGGQPWMKK
jgi:hypothetical protein